eukprot:13434471-Alexandrium_andersonii.AAC.1
MEANISPARLEDVAQDMRPLDAQTLIRANGALLAEEVSVLLGEGVARISRRVWAGRHGDRAEQEGHGAFPFASGDSEARLQWLSQ